MCIVFLCCAFLDPKQDGHGTTFESFCLAERPTVAVVDYLEAQEVGGKVCEQSLVENSLSHFGEQMAWHIREQKELFPCAEVRGAVAAGCYFY